MKRSTVLYRGGGCVRGWTTGAGQQLVLACHRCKEGATQVHQDTQVCWVSFNTGSIESSYSRNTGNKARGSTFCDSTKTYKNR